MLVNKNTCEYMREPLQKYFFKTKISLDYNEWLKRLDTQLNEPTFPNATIVTKIVMPTNKKTLL